MAPSSNLSHLFDPHSIAVVGASSDPTKIGFEVFNSMATSKKVGSYSGDLYPVNPRYSEIAGIPCCPNVASIKGDVDLAGVVVPSQNTPAVIPHVWS